MYREGEISVPNPTPLEGEVRFIQATDQHMSQHVVREW